MMTIDKAISLLTSLKNESTKESEIRVYKEFIHILKRLDERGLSKEEIESVEEKLQDLNLESEPKNRKRYFKKQLHSFKEFLNESFSLTTKNHYENLYLIIGMVFGVTFGILIGEASDKSMGISLGICMGMLIGILIGRFKDAEAEKEGKVI
ncbi:hypothetical protein LCM02_11475 [Lutimonas saemankumensis]|uniref:hypothetical protein n=1 Tax=Lutimonas saemankumensis TaxID=483016 RepID=UPI001CD52E88|nr:hypothetical protein [Lutimonas saemankumensis]MCA0933075.1 hypothetical protein [Lutimonas saemankumensis]